MKYEYKKPTEQVVKVMVSFLFESIQLQSSEGTEVKSSKRDQSPLRRLWIKTNMLSSTGIHLSPLPRNHIQNILYQGVILKKLASVGPLNEKKENLVVKTVSKNEE